MASADLLPTQFWGLDPIFRTHVKLYIKDILSLQPVDGHPGIFQFGCHPIVRVDVQGVVVRVEERPRFFGYSLDDGTGVINCTHWKPDEHQQQTPPDSGSLPSALASKWAEVHSLKQSSHEGHSLGDLVQVRGKLKVFRDYIEVMASQCVCVRDPNKETERILLLPLLYTRCYSKQLKLPDVIQAAQADGHIEELCRRYELETAILNHLQSHHVQTISRSDILTVDSITSILAQSSTKEELLTKTIQDLEKGGHIFTNSHEQDDNVYMVTCQCTALRDTITSIIRQWITIKGDQEGCSDIYIYGKVKGLGEFRHLKQSALTQCLEQLEADSDIISTADKRYIVFND